MKAVGRRTLLQAGMLIGAVAAGGCGREDAPPNGEVDLLVVGAGVAGLAAAGYAAGQGLRCVVLEARDRVGGRIWTSAEWPKVPVDLGASWIHGTDGNPVYDEITRLGIETAVFDVGSSDGVGSLISVLQRNPTRHRGRRRSARRSSAAAGAPRHELRVDAGRDRRAARPPARARGAGRTHRDRR